MAEGVAPLVVEVMAPSLVTAGLARLFDASRRPAPAGTSDPGSPEALRLLGLLDRVHERFGPRVVVHLVEPFSLAWIIRVIRFRPRRYPLFIVGGRTVVAGLDEAALTRSIAARLHPASAP